MLSLYLLCCHKQSHRVYFVMSHLKPAVLLSIFYQNDIIMSIYSISLKFESFSP